MNTDRAKTLALNLMSEHGLVNDGWNFRFSRGRNEFGACRTKWNQVTGHIYKEITLSRKLSTDNNEIEVKDTILHEIAHALVGCRDRHGLAWKHEATRIGAKPIAKFSTNEVTMSYKWTGTCADCGRQWKRHRVNQRSQVIGSVHFLCRGKENNGHVEWKNEL